MMQEVGRYLRAQDLPRQRVAMLEERAAQAEEGHRQSVKLLTELREHTRQVVAGVVEVVRRSLIPQRTETTQVQEVNSVQTNMIWDMSTKHKDIDVQGNTLTMTGSNSFAGIVGGHTLQKDRTSRWNCKVHQSN